MLQEELEWQNPVSLNIWVLIQVIVAETQIAIQRSSGWATLPLLGLTPTPLTLEDLFPVRQASVIKGNTYFLYELVANKQHSSSFQLLFPIRTRF